jgi:hypothetical protein
MGSTTCSGEATQNWKLAVPVEASAPYSNYLASEQYFARRTAVDHVSNLAQPSLEDVRMNLPQQKIYKTPKRLLSYSLYSSFSHSIWLVPTSRTQTTSSRTFRQDHPNLLSDSLNSASILTGFHHNNDENA